MKPRTLLVLLALVAGLGAFIAFYEKDLPGSEERAKRAKRIFDLDVVAVEGLTVERGGSVLAFSRVEKPKDTAPETSDEAEPPPSTAADWGWRLRRPLEAKADAAAVGRLIDTLVGLERSRTIDDAIERDTGLDKPAAVLRFATTAGEKVLEIGAEVPTGGGRVVRFRGAREAYVVPATFWNDLLREPGEWRDHQLFTGDREGIARIVLAPAGRAPVILVKRGDRFDVEAVAAGRADRADREMVDALLSDLTGFSADRFVAPPAIPAEMGLAPPKIGRVEVTSKGQPAPFVVELGGQVGSAGDGQAPEIYARAGGEVVTTRSRLADSLGRGAQDWRSHALASLDVFEVERAKVADAKGTFEVVRSGVDWTRGQDTISSTTVSDLLYALTELRAERLVDAAAGPGRPVLSIVLSGSGGRSETLSFFAKTPDGLPARVGGRDATLVLSADKLGDLERRVADVRAAQPVAKESEESGSDKAPE